MKLVCMKLFSDFECTGKYCRHNCCKTGWDIEIDKPTLDYLDSVGDCSLRSITETDEDGTQSTVSGDDVAKLSIRQGTAWVNFRNYPAESYGPDVALAVSGQAEGSTTVTARHYTLSQLQDELELNVTKLTGKLLYSKLSGS